MASPAREARGSLPLRSSSKSMSKEEKKKISKQTWSSASTLFTYLKPYWLPYSIGMVLLIVSGLLVIVITTLLGKLMVPNQPIATAPGLTDLFADKLSFAQDWGATGITLGTLVALLIVQGVFSFFRVYLFSFATENAMMALRRDTFSTIIRMPMQFFNERRVGDLSSRISADIATIQETMQWTLAEFIRQIIIIIVGIGGLVAFSYKLTLVMLCSLPVIILVMVFFGKFIKKMGKVTQDKVADSGVIVNETLTGIVNVKSFANEAYEIGRFTESARIIRSFAMKSALWRGMFGTFIIIFLFGALGLVIGVGAHLQETGELSAQVLPQFILLTGLVAGSIGGLAAQMGTIQRSLGVIEGVMEILHFSPEKTSAHQRDIQTPIKGNVTFEKVAFHYESRADVTVLNHLSFDVKEGQQLAIVGSSGSGKSTIASLIQQFYKPVSGQVLFDGKPATGFDLTELRSQMAFVPQEVILFGGTIRENIAYGKPNASEQEIREAAQQANALGFIEGFPDKWETIVGERGIQLSGGQRQRIAIARAVLRNPVILILDEATSSLDSESERLVQGALDNLMKGRTSIVIAHRLSTVRSADKIIVLEKGAIAEEGTHEQLIQKADGLYKRLSELQYHKESSTAQA
jgi:ABC-type multidrug transport system fused ATPase/permease subunit